MSVHEIQVLVLFLALICLWFFKTPLFMPGWGDMFDVRQRVENLVKLSFYGLYNGLTVISEAI